MEEIFDLVDEAGRIIGSATRSRCHSDPSLMHPVVHVVVFGPTGEIFLQKRSMTKDIQPGKWDTSVGGHLHRGETPEAGAARELGEELGVEGAPLTFAYQYIWRSPVETELVTAFATLWSGPVRLQASEIDDGRFWAQEKIAATLGSGVFTPQFANEFPRMRAWWAEQGHLLSGGAA